MNMKRLVVTIIVVFLVSFFAGFFFHAIWLEQDYQLVANLYRPEGQEKMAFIVLANLFLAIGAVWLYAHGVEDKPWLGQGLRFGIALFLVATVPWFLITYAVQPYPLILIAKIIICEGITKIILGIITALLYRR